MYIYVILQNVIRLHGYEKKEKTSLKIEELCSKFISTNYVHCSCRALFPVYFNKLCALQLQSFVPSLFPQIVCIAAVESCSEFISTNYVHCNCRALFPVYFYKLCALQLKRFVPSLFLQIMFIATVELCSEFISKNYVHCNCRALLRVY